MLPNLFITLAQLGAFIVTVLIFFFFVFKPLKKKLKERREHIETNIRESEQAKAKAEKSEEVAYQNIQNSRIEANRILIDAKKTADDAANKILEDANAQADQIRKQGEKDAIEMKNDMERQAHDTIVTTALEASKKILEREIDEEDNSKIVRDFIDQMKKDADSER